MKNLNFFDFFGMDNPYPRTNYNDSYKLFYFINHDEVASMPNYEPITEPVFNKKTPAMAFNVRAESKDKIDWFMIVSFIAVIVIASVIIYFLHQEYKNFIRAKEAEKYSQPL